MQLMVNFRCIFFLLFFIFGHVCLVVIALSRICVSHICNFCWKSFSEIKTTMWCLILLYISIQFTEPWMSKTFFLYVCCSMFLSEWCNLVANFVFRACLFVNFIIFTVNLFHTLCAHPHNIFCKLLFLSSYFGENYLLLLEVILTNCI